jgi:hypothetical protein
MDIARFSFLALPLQLATQPWASHLQGLEQKTVEVYYTVAAHSGASGFLGREN